MNPLAKAIGDEIRGIFAADDTRGDSFEPGVGLFPADAVSRRVHGDVTTMMIGGVSALMLQMLHPGALAGVWDHSNFRDDMQGRLRRTGRFIGATTYARTDDALAAIDRVRRVHKGVNGTRPDGSSYSAFDPHLLNWVHVTELVSFLAAWKRYREPRMGRHDEDVYFAENEQIAKRLGARDVPVSRTQVDAFLKGIRPELVADDRVTAVRAALLDHKAENRAVRPAYGLLMKAGIDLLPDWALRMHRQRFYPGERLAVRSGAAALVRTIGWALSASRPA